MSQFGMQLPGGRAKRAASPDMFTALAFIAVAFLTAACAVMWQAASHVGKDGSPFQPQEAGNIVIKQATP
ncbi:MAG: hypothetical protein JNL50_12670 [Phycisphaerae bacterium]|nr:hypothetical protein [Phycisphaerae bacterium]